MVKQLRRLMIVIVPRTFLIHFLKKLRIAAEKLRFFQNLLE